MESAATWKIRPARHDDIPALVELFDAYMREFFKTPWRGSARELLRDGFGLEFEMMVAVTGAGKVFGLVAWRRGYDWHNCITGGYVLDLYVSVPCRGRGVAPALIFNVAAEVSRRGGKFIQGHAFDNPAVERFYGRVAVCHPSSDCTVGGRAFHRLAELAGASPRTAARQLPDKALNFEP